jgi:hypothetical protein
MAIKDIPVDIVSDEEFNKRWGTQEDGSWRGYAAGTQTERRRANEADELSAALALEEQKRSALVKEDLARQELAESIRANKANESYQWASLAKRGSGGGSSGGSNLSNTELLNAIRNGAIQYAQGLTKGEPFKETRGLYKGQTFMSSGETPENAAKLTIKMLQSELGNLPISNSNYNDIVKQVYLSLGLEPPTSGSSSNDDLMAALERLRIE